MELLAATKNKGKAREIATILSDIISNTAITVKTLEDFPDIGEVEEDSTTYQGNARKKALHAAGKTGLISIADDSGLEVDLLGGIPGVYSSRLAGTSATDEENIEKLVSLIKKRGETKSKARFRSVICLVTPENKIFFSEGVCEGLVITEKRGLNGFGYDPVFLIQDMGKTFAELTSTEKNRISHRTKAIINIIPILKDLINRYT